MASEKSLLVDLVAKHFAIVENKKTDGTTLRQKSEEWKIIAQEYNSQTALVHRLAENLKAQWEAMKKAAKKEAADSRMAILKTGKVQFKIMKYLSIVFKLFFITYFNIKLLLFGE